MSLEAADHITSIFGVLSPVVGFLFWLLISSRFVSKKTYWERLEASDKKRESQEAKIAQLERNAALAEQPVSAVVKKLGEIEALIERYFAEQRAETANHREEQAKQRTEIELLKQKTSPPAKRSRGSSGR